MIDFKGQKEVPLDLTRLTNEELLSVHRYVKLRQNKHAAHLIRILRQGAEFLIGGEMNVLRHDAPQLIAIKKGEWELREVQDEAGRLFKLAEQAYLHSKLPDNPMVDQAEKLLMSILKDSIIGYSAKE